MSSATSSQDGGGSEYWTSSWPTLRPGPNALDCGDEDIQRIRALLTLYADLGLSYTDAAVIACAERNGGKLLPFDRRDFDIVARPLLRAAPGLTPPNPAT